jgi:hypothetical protein
MIELLFVKKKKIILSKSDYEETHIERLCESKYSNFVFLGDGGKYRCLLACWQQ